MKPEVRKALVEYREERARTDAIAAPLGMGARIHRMRMADADLEALVARELTGEKGLGILPLIAWPIIIGGGAVLTTGLSYLTEREQRIQAELDPDSQEWSTVVGGAMEWVFPALVAGSIVVGGYLLLDTVSKGKRKKSRTK